MIYDVHLTSNFVRADVCLCSYAKIVFEKLVSTNHSFAFAQKATDKFMVYLNVHHLFLKRIKILSIDIHYSDYISTEIHSSILQKCCILNYK